MSIENPQNNIMVNAQAYAQIKGLFAEMRTMGNFDIEADLERELLARLKDPNVDPNEIVLEAQNIFNRRNEP